MTVKKTYEAPCVEQSALEIYAAIAVASGVNVDDYPGDIWGEETEW